MILDMEHENLSLMEYSVFCGLRLKSWRDEKLFVENI